MPGRFVVASRNVAILFALYPFLPAANAHAQARGGYAQSVLQDVMKRHPEVKGMEFAARRGDGCVTVAATDAGDIGDKCDGDEKRALRSTEPEVDDPSWKDHFYVVTDQLHDSTGAVIGLIITDIAPQKTSGRAAALASSRAIREEVEARLRSAEQLGESANAAGAAPPAPVNAPYAPRLDARTFASAVTNPYFPLVPGTTFRYNGTGDAAGETTVTTVTPDTREIMGIRATVVHDQVFDGNELKEDTYDWYAQDADGNVWYLGEDTKEYKNGRVTSTEGSWEAGVGGAKPGIAMWADPAAHMFTPYHQEYLSGVAEDMGKVTSVHGDVVVPYGKFRDCVETEDTSALEPQVREHKYYCRGVGIVKEVESAKEGSELVAVEKRSETKPAKPNKL